MCDHRWHVVIHNATIEDLYRDVRVCSGCDRAEFKRDLSVDWLVSNHTKDAMIHLVIRRRYYV